MEIDIIASSSKGNCIALTYKNETILLDAGVDITYIRDAFYNAHMPSIFHQIKGVVVSHIHQDHALGLDQWPNVILPITTPNSINTIGSFTFISFSIQHDVPNSGFVIMCGNYKILWFTDCSYIKQQDINQLAKIEFDALLMEANHTLAQYQWALDEGNQHYYNYRRHMNVQETAEIFNQIARSKDTPVALLHLTTNPLAPTPLGVRKVDIQTYIKANFVSKTQATNVYTIAPNLYAGNEGNHQTPIVSIHLKGK